MYRRAGAVYWFVALCGAGIGCRDWPNCVGAWGGVGDASSSEREGVAVGATLWALFFFTDPAGVRAGQQVKIVWRMTGSGAVSFVASGPDGRTDRPVWGPEAHSGSNWSRPGDEWGTGWVFPVRGQWTVRVARADQGTGRLTVQVR